MGQVTLDDWDCLHHRLLAADQHPDLETVAAGPGCSFLLLSRELAVLQTQESTVLGCEACLESVECSNDRQQGLQRCFRLAFALDLDQAGRDSRSSQSGTVRCQLGGEVVLRDQGDPASASSSFEVGTDPSSSSAVVAGAFGLVVAAAAGSSDQGAFDQVALAFALDLVASSALVGSFAVG